MKKKISLSGHHRSIGIVHVNSSLLETIYSSGLCIEKQSWQLWLSDQDREIVQGFLGEFDVQVGEEVYPNDFFSVKENNRVLKRDSLIVYWESNIVSFEYIFKNKFNSNSLSIEKNILDFGDNSETYDFFNVTYNKFDFNQVNIRNIDSGLFIVDPEEGVVDLSVKNLNDDDEEEGFVFFVE